MQDQQRVVSIEGLFNFRDLGGYTNTEGCRVRWHKVYRSAQLDRLTPQGIDQLKALSVKTVVDLRFSEESQHYPTLRDAVPNALMLSWHDEQFAEQDELTARTSKRVVKGWRDALDSGDPAQVREAMRLNYPEKLYSHAAIYRRMLLALIQNDTPLVFHCAAGKDRTGVAAALILGVLDVDRGTIIEDYLITQSQMGDLVHSWMAGGATAGAHYADFQRRLLELPQELVAPVFEADASYIVTLLDYVQAQYGDFATYATRRLGLTEDDLVALKQHLLMPE